MIGRVKLTVQARRGAGTSWPMGRVFAGALVEWTISKNGWLQIGLNRWIPASAVSVIGEAPPPPPPPPVLDGDIRMIRFHSEMPEEERNGGSFGIVRVYAHPKADKPHSIFLDDVFIDSVRAINSPRAFQWLFEHDDTKSFGAHLEGGGYSIPAQGVFMGNLVRVVNTHGNFSQLAGIIGSIPPGMNYLTNPESIHFCWCVRRDGQTINPPCGVAYMPVLNPLGMRGSYVNGEQQSEIWIQNKWLKEISQ